MTTQPTIVWFRRDLRINDNPALAAAARSGGAVVPLYIDDEGTGDWAMGAASCWWLDGSLRSLEKSFKRHGVTLTLRRGPALASLLDVIKETGACRVVWNRVYEADGIQRDTDIKRELRGHGIEVDSFNGALIYEPWELCTGDGNPYRVFTPFWKSMLRSGVPRQPVELPQTLNPLKTRLVSDNLDDWQLRPVNPDWANGFASLWTPGEDAAWQRIEAFADDAIADYHTDRDRPDRDGTSCLSPHLHFGEISPISVWYQVFDVTENDSKRREQAMAYLREIAWREFCHNVLYYNPTLPDKNLKTTFDVLPWRKDPKGLIAWQKGQTGFPIVDAGMRQLWYTGWMHNRVRMIAASFLIKDLMIHWREGERWFWDTLVDADLANNAAGWQWVAGSGTDAAPYFRVFNPTTQAKKFDPDGKYIREWIPQIAELPNDYIHEPDSAPEAALKEAGITLGVHYPRPIVDHKFARERALDAYQRVRAAKA